MISPDEVGFGLTVVSIATAAAAFAASVGVTFEAIRALRAKNRAKWYLVEKATRDRALSSLVGHPSSAELTTEQLAQQIEKAIRDHLSESDQKFVKQGLHQSSKTGARRYCEDVLSAA